jgi:hypothetical protein
MPNLNHIPRQRGGHHLEEIDGESVVFGRTSAKAYFMNDTASLVWKLSDGSRSAKQIIDLFIETYPENKSEIAADVAQVFDRLVAEGLLIMREPPA